MDNQGPSIFVIDDHSENISFLFSFLTQHQFSVAAADNGADAIAIARDTQPDLILLDILMPGVDGFEVCRRLKTDPVTCDIPIIFMSAITDTPNKVKGLQLGAVDYLTKPIQAEELLARVNTHIKLQQQKNDLLEMIREKSEFLNIAAHDLKNPLNSILMILNLIEHQDLAGEETAEYLKMMRDNAGSMSKLVENLLCLGRQEAGRIEMHMASMEMLPALQSLLQHYRPLAEEKQLALRLEAVPDDNCPARVDERMCLQVMDNLLSNALKYSPPHSTVILRLRQEPGTVCWEVEDQGPGFSEADRQRMFDKFTRLSARPTGGESSTGLGLFIVKNLLDMMKGRIHCDSAPGRGAKFTVHLPAAAEEKEEEGNPPCMP